MISLLRTRPTDRFGGTTYIERVVSGLTSVLADDVQDLQIVSFRTRGSNALPLPMGAFTNLSPALSRVAGGVLWRRRSCHRMDLRIPPAPTEIISVLDLAPLHFSDEGEFPRHALDSICRARGVICLSNFIANEVLSLGAQQIWVAPPGVDERFFAAEPLTAEARNAHGLPPGKFVLHVGGLTARKGGPLLAQAWKLIAERRPDLHLVMAGPPSTSREAHFGRLPRVHFLGSIDDDVLAALMRSTTALVVASSYEGWGMPAAEALAAGTCVVAVKCSALPEVVGDLAHLVEPTPGALAAGLENAATEVGDQRRVLARRARARQFTWERAVTTHVTAYTEGLGLGHQGNDLARPVD